MPTFHSHAYNLLDNGLLLFFSHIVLCKKSCQQGLVAVYDVIGKDKSRVSVLFYDAASFETSYAFGFLPFPPINSCSQVTGNMVSDFYGLCCFSMKKGSAPIVRECNLI